jgi:hypothetical protein
VGIHHHVEGTRSVLHDEVIAEQLACPLVLGGCRQLLIEDEAKAAVVGADDEPAPPQIWALVANCLDKADQLALVGGELSVSRGDGLGVEGDRFSPLVQDSPEPGA